MKMFLWSRGREDSNRHAPRAAAILWRSSANLWFAKPTGQRTARSVPATFASPRPAAARGGFQAEDRKEAEWCDSASFRPGTAARKRSGRRRHRSRFPAFCLPSSRFPFPKSAGGRRRGPELPAHPATATFAARSRRRVPQAVVLRALEPIAAFAQADFVRPHLGR